MSQQSTEGWITAYDGVDWEAMPADGAHFLYVDGDYAAPPEAHQAYPQAYTIAVDPATPADEYDVENGNPDHPVTWAVMMRQTYDYIGRIYCSEFSVPTVLDQFTTAGLLPPRFRIAAWTGTAPAEVEQYGSGTDGVQYGNGDTFDTSIIRPDLPHHDPAPVPGPSDAPTPEEEPMPTATSINGRAGLPWPASRCHVIQVNYAAADQSDLVLGIELKLTTGPVYPDPWTISHETGTGTYEIPAEHIETCRGAILTVHTGPTDVIYDALAV